MSEQKQYRMADVKELALKCGFKLKQQPNGDMDLNPYVYRFADTLLQRQQARIAALEDDIREWIKSYPDANHDPSLMLLENTTPDVRSKIEKDGLPTFYISTEGTVCTHRMSDTDTPVWCRNGEDGIEAMRAITDSDGWISVDERLPEQSGPYWTFCGKEEPSVIQQRVYMYDSEFKQFNDCLVTHWRELPSKPAAGGAES